MVEEDLNEFEEEAAEEQLEQQMEAQHELQSDLLDETPYSGTKDDLWSLFKWTVAKQDSSKLANLGERELGMLNISVRDMQRIALIADTLEHPGFSEFFKKQAEIILATSASKKGWQQELFVSQRKYNTKSRGEMGNSPVVPQQPQKRGFFKRWVG